MHQSTSSVNSGGSNGSSSKQLLMTRRQYTDPLGSDDEDDSTQSPSTIKQYSAPVTPAHRVHPILTAINTLNEIIYIS